jgi:hypothetical protein
MFGLHFIPQAIANANASDMDGNYARLLKKPGSFSYFECKNECVAT